MGKKKQAIMDVAGNPFSDSQARNYSDKRVVTEFCPIAQFWSLFNDQHEILIGTRGCGKTILLKMMRYSMLNKLSDPRAQRLVKEKKYIAFYVPLHLEFIKKLSNSELSLDEKISWFRFSFNCALAQSVILEFSELLKDIYLDDLERVKAEYQLSQIIDQIWGIDSTFPVYQLSKVREKVVKLFYSTNPFRANILDVPNPFILSFGSVLSAISSSVCDVFNISPTWILCVDEAEFVDECYQRCINTAFRSDTDRIAIKMATLYYYHTTKKTLDDNIEVMDGQDFKYTIIDMKYDSTDFINVTDCIVRTRFCSENISIETLDGFVETLQGDSYLDYYTKEVGEEEATATNIQDQILCQISEKSKTHNAGKSYDELRKPVFDKLAPIFYLREVYKKRGGRYIPGWYAGATMVRRIAQGNPRIFIRIMNELYNTAVGKRLPLDLKHQHNTIENFARSFCKETETLEGVGPEAKAHLEYISDIIHLQTHGSILISSGLSFMIKENNNLENHLSWIKKSIAFSRLMVDADSLKTDITHESKFQLANLYAVQYWLPMRAKTPIKINLHEDVPLTYKITKQTIKKTKSSHQDVISGQLSLFSEEG